MLKVVSKKQPFFMINLLNLLEKSQFFAYNKTSERVGKSLTAYNMFDEVRGGYQ